MRNLFRVLLPAGLISLLMGLWLAQVSAVLAQVSPAPQNPKIDQFMQLLADPEVQGWLKNQIDAKPAQPSPQLGAVEERPSESVGSELARRVTRLREHLSDMVAAVPRVHGEVATAISRIRQERSQTDGIGALLLIFGFLVIGFAAEWFFAKAVSKVRDRVHSGIAATPRERLVRLLARFVLGLGGLVVFALASIGFFLAFSWPELMKQVVLIFLLAGLTTKLVWMLLELLLAPGDEAARVIPMSNTAARFYRVRITLFIGWLAFGYAFVDVLRGHGVDRDVAQLIAYVLGLGLLAIALETVWQRPRPVAAGNTQPEATRAGEPVRRRTAANWALAAGFTAIWAMWVLGLIKLFWLVLALLIVPVMIRQMRRGVYSIFSTTQDAAPTSAPSVMAALVERVLRAAIILAAIWIVARGWDVSFSALAAETDTVNRFGRSMVIVLMILLAIDLVWNLLKTIIDAAIEKSRAPGPAGSSDEVRRSKIRTLLPPIRNVTLFFLVTLAVFMTLSTLGVEIGPLIASAGVVGVAIGFGAQTLFKDMISGMFYLMDDAFRIGEYIVAGDYRGTVESFSLRSVRLRHHRGPVYTVPFGSLGAVQNLSRDFVIDKFVLNITYDSDVEKARVLLKNIGKELAADPELAPLIIEPMKMQAIGDLGDAGVQIKVKMMCVPNGQYMVRKKAYPLIKQRFEENGIVFAYPTVKIADEGENAHEPEVKLAVARKVTAQRSTAKTKG
jgi:small-conductance mechanosensitive channel